MRGIARLAQELGISTGTVSRALNDRPEVSEATRRKVLETAERLGYTPNQAARTLAQGTTRCVGFMIETYRDATSNSDNFFLGVVDGIQLALGQHNLDLYVLPCPTGTNPTEHLQRVVRRGAVDAMIISATLRNDARIDLLLRERIPFVALGRSATGSGYPWIDLDFEGVANAAVDRLVAGGHREIALGLTDNDLNLGHIFLKGYRDALARHGIPYNPSNVIRTPSTEQGGYRIADELLAMKQRPSAIVLIYEMMAIGMYRRLNEAGLLPGRDLAIVAFREPPLAPFLSPSLTCFRMSPSDLGESLGAALLAVMPALAHAVPREIINRVWPMELVPGESDLPRRAP